MSDVDNPWNALAFDAINTWDGPARRRYRGRGALISSKDTRTVITGGQYPRASVPEWNFGLDLDATRYVVDGWPTPIVFDGFETGLEVLVGNNVCAAHPAGSPARAAFDVLYGCGNPQRDGTGPGIRPRCTTPSTARAASTGWLGLAAVSGGRCGRR